MLLNRDRRGITGIIDAMIFITIMTIVFAAMYTVDEGTDIGEGNDASALSDSILSSKFKLNDIMDVNDSKIVSMTDLMAATAISGNDDLPQYLTSVMDSITGNQNSYSLTVTYGNSTFTIGEKREIARSSCYTESQVTYGGSVCTLLELY